MLTEVHNSDTLQADDVLHHVCILDRGVTVPGTEYS